MTNDNNTLLLMTIDKLQYNNNRPTLLYYFIIT